MIPGESIEREQTLNHKDSLNPFLLSAELYECMHMQNHYQKRFKMDRA